MPLRRQAEQLGDEAAHRVADQHAREHEAVARVGLQLVELVLEPHERQRVAGAVELAHFVDQDRVEVGQQIGDRRIDGDLAEALGILALGARGEQAFGEDVGVAVALGAVGGQQHFAMLFEVEQPVGQLEIVDVEQFAAALERRRIFAVRIDHHDMALGRELRDAVEDQRDRGRLAGAGRSRGSRNASTASGRRRACRGCRRSDRRCRSRRAALSSAAKMARMSSVVTGQDLAARDRVAGDAAAEAEQAAVGVLAAFAEEVDIGDDRAVVAGAQRADVGDQPARCRPSS